MAAHQTTWGKFAQTNCCCSVVFCIWCFWNNLTDSTIYWNVSTVFAVEAPLLHTRTKLWKFIIINFKYKTYIAKSCSNDCSVVDTIVVMTSTTCVVTCYPVTNCCCFLSWSPVPY